MKLKDISAGPDWVVWIAFIVFAVFSICRVMGSGMAVIAVLILIMGVFESILPVFFVYISI